MIATRVPYCSRCGEMRPEGDFYPSELRRWETKRDTGLYCKQCRREYSRERDRAARTCDVSGIDTAVCGKCGEQKSARYFYQSSLRAAVAARRSLWCRECHRRYYDMRVEEDPEYFRRYQREIRRERRRWIDGIKRADGCRDCGEDDPACLDFHHLDPGTKKASVSRLFSQMTALDVLAAEVEKCVVLCANCHRKVHRRKRN